MADVKISQLTEVAASAGADLLECVQSGASRRTTVQKLLDWIKAQATTWTGKQTFQGYTVLGESAPAVKCKVLTGTTPLIEGDPVPAAMGIPYSKVLGVTAVVTGYILGGDRMVTPGTTTLAGVQYDLYTVGNTAYIRLHATNSENILGMGFTIFIWYQE